MNSFSNVEFFEWLEVHMEALVARDPEALASAVERSCQNKAEVVALDEREMGERATLNLGHTFGHAIETGLGYGAVLHGEAVAIGTLLAADLSCRLGYLKVTDIERIKRLLIRARLPTTVPPGLSPEDFLVHMAVDKKNVEGQLRLILLKRIGEAHLPMQVELNLIKQTLSSAIVLH